MIVSVHCCVIAFIPSSGGRPYSGPPLSDFGGVDSTREDFGVELIESMRGRPEITFGGSEREREAGLALFAGVF